MNKWEALKESIAHHKRNLAAENPEDVKIGPSHCALCELYNNYQNECLYNECLNCPVYENTGEIFCKDTPYEQLHEKLMLWKDNINYPEWSDFFKDMFRKAEQDEIKFLESLRLKKETENG